MLAEHPTIEQIAKRLDAPIPAPYRPPPKLQASWRTLKVGQFLESTVPLHPPDLPPLVPGTRFEVVECNSDGAKLTVQSHFTGPGESATPPMLLWTDTDWKKTFKRARKPTKRSPKDEIPSPTHS